MANVQITDLVAIGRGGKTYTTTFSDLKESVLRGSACAAIVVSRPGCAGAMPTIDELGAFLKTHSPKAT
jgi:sugar/nucleoside kinase (ribokinase family)